ncbi:DUF2975 domain-containing protein [uncultured Nocardioides sp.]|uniref:DUF2975 domain-containing protein n=1 Tax=uncultured Nocardioides sp. TaxID=198441 RepID=UPI00262347B3|nr:DUF2975 domain-containing protein [uncultured Nocardioides sp.]
MLVGLVVAVMAVLAAATLAGTVLGSGTVPGLNAEVCATGSGDQAAFRRGDGDTTGPVGLRDGITWRVDEVQVCDPDPDGATRALAGAGLVVWVGGPMVFFVMLWLFLRRARREGVFADRVPGQLRTLGRILLMWPALDFVLSGWVNAALLNRMTDSTLILTATVPWLPVLLGISLLALARVMGEAVGMRRDVEATI